MCLNNHKTPELSEKVYELIDVIKKRTLNEVFQYKEIFSLEDINENKNNRLIEENKSQINSKDLNTVKKHSENYIKISENNIESYQKGLIKEIFDEKNKKILETKIQINSRNYSSIKRNGVYKRETENFNGRIQSVYRYKGNFSNNKTSLINKYKSILMSKKIHEEKKNKMNKDLSSNELINIDDNQFDLLNFDSSMLSCRENGSNLTNYSGFNQKLKYFSMKEDIEKKRKEYLLQRKSNILIKFYFF